MDIRWIEPDFAVSAQISPQDMPAISAAGFRTILCNRPDEEVPAPLGHGPIAAAAASEGLGLVFLPITHGSLTTDAARRQHQAVTEGPGPVLAYCASGTRSTLAWAIGAVLAGRDIDAVLAAAARAGHDLAALRPQLAALAPATARDSGPGDDPPA